MPNRDRSYYDYDQNPDPRRAQSSINFDPRSQRADRDDWGPNPTNVSGGDYHSRSTRRYEGIEFNRSDRGEYSERNNPDEYGERMPSDGGRRGRNTHDHHSFSGASQGLGAQGTGWHEARYGVQNEFDAANRYRHRTRDRNRNRDLNPNSRHDDSPNRGLHAGKGPKGYRRSDERIHEEVCEALTHDPHVDASDIDIRVENGVVTLSGTVEDRQMKRDAEDCAEDCRGVDDVKNELKVRKADLWDKIKGQEALDQEAKGQRMDGSATVASAKLQ